MKTLAATVVLGFALALGAARAGADQSDPRLESLFAHLKTAPDVQAAHDVEVTIWTIWGQSDDPAVRLLMADGLAAMERRDLRAALGKFEQVVTIAPGFAEGWNKRATVHYLLGHYAASLYDIEKTLALEPRHFGALSGRGLVYMALGEEALALQSFEAALEIHPQLPGATANAEALRRRLHSRDI